MTPNELATLIRQGENTAVEFKALPLHPEVLARALVAFANSNGGVILLGVADDGALPGVKDEPRLEEWVVNIARTSVVPALSGAKKAGVP